MQLIWSQLLKLGAGDVPFTQLPRNYKRSDEQKNKNWIKRKVKKIPGFYQARSA